MTGLVLGRFDATTLSTRLKDAGVYAALEAKGFGGFEVSIDAPGRGMPHTRLFACKQQERFLLLDACITELALAPEFFRRRGYPIDRPMDLVSLYWLREEDPTAEFTGDRPRLPLQHHPGLGILRSAFQTLVAMAREQERDGVACMPKFFHDAVIFFRSRLFLFLDGAQQGRFEALRRDLRPLPLGTASLLLATDALRDQAGGIVRWEFAPQVLPLSAVLCGYFNSSSYADTVATAFHGSHFTWTTDSVRQVDTLARSAAW